MEHWSETQIERIPELDDKSKFKVGDKGAAATDREIP
jgi:hypothetical protein